MVLTNVLGVAYTIRAVLPHFQERSKGHFLLTSSVAGRRSLPGSLYSATKHAVTGMGESLRQEVRQQEGSEVRVTLDRAGHGRHAVLLRPARRRRSRPTTSPAS